MRNDHYIIQALDFARINPKGFTQKELEKHLGMERNKWHTLSDQFGQGEKYLFNQSGGREDDALFHLSLTGIKLLLELETTRDARNSLKQAESLSRRSVWISACVAIVVTIIGPLIASFFSSEVKLDSSQFQQLQEILDKVTP